MVIATRVPLRMSFLTTLLVLILALVVLHAVMRRVEKGRLESRCHSGGCTFRTDLGSFRIESQARQFVHVTGSARRAYAFDEIRGLEYRFNETLAAFHEAVTGVEVTDMLPSGRDTTMSYTIDLITKQGERVSLYLITQYQPREMFLNWALDLEARLFRKLGIHEEVHDKALGDLHKLQAMFSRCGCPLALL